MILNKAYLAEKFPIFYAQNEWKTNNFFINEVQK